MREFTGAMHSVDKAVVRELEVDRRDCLRGAAKPRVLDRNAVGLDGSNRIGTRLKALKKGALQSAALFLCQRGEPNWLHNRRRVRRTRRLCQSETAGREDCQVGRSSHSTSFGWV